MKATLDESLTHPLSSLEPSVRNGHGRSVTDAVTVTDNNSHNHPSGLGPVGKDRCGVPCRVPEPGSTILIALPLHLAPTGNRREHPLARARRTRREIAAVLAELAACSPPSLPVLVEMNRVGWNALDPDGLVAACKAPIDAVARWLKVDDRDRRLRWRLSQSITREVRVSRTGDREAMSSLWIKVRRWSEADGDDWLRVVQSQKTAHVRRNDED